MAFSRTCRQARQYGAVRYASVFVKKYNTLVRYAFPLVVRVRYVGTGSFFCNGTVRWCVV